MNAFFYTGESATILNRVGEQHAEATNPLARNYLACIMGMWAETVSFEHRSKSLHNPFNDKSEDCTWFTIGRLASISARKSLKI